MRAATSSEMLLSIYQTTRQHITENGYFHSHFH